MRFLGPGLGDRVPDAKTVWLYREALAQAGMVETLFKQFDGYLARQGYIARGGQILDASIVPVPRNHNTRAENKAIKTKQSKQARYPRIGRTSLPNGLGRMLMLAGPRNTGAAITATKTTSMWTVSTS